MKKFTILLLSLVCQIYHLQAQLRPISEKAAQYIMNREGVFKDVSLTQADFRVSASHVSSISGVAHLYYQQTLNGLDVTSAVGSVHLNKNEEVAHATSGFLNTAEFSIQGGQVLSGSDAIYRTAQYFEISDIGDVRLLEDTGGSDKATLYVNKKLSGRDIRAKLKYLPKDQQLILVWEVFIEKADDGFMYLVYINAQTGEVEKTTSLTVECDFGHGIGDNDYPPSVSSTSDQTPLNSHDEQYFTPNSYLVYPIPLEAPNEGQRSVVTSPWNSSSPFGWHDVDGASGAEFTITRGNNVRASEDTLALNVAGFSPDGGATLDFNFPLDTSMHPRTYLSGSITNLFYMNNIMHDVTYNYGFDEVAGNFQANNYGNGGSAFDEVIADAQDGSGTNNANFGTPVDGSKPRMQMFRWVTALGSLTVNTPGGIAGAYTAAGAHFNPAMSSVTGEVVLAIPNQACSAITNSSEVNGKIALIDRGTCSFVLKVENAVAAGAIGVIVCNNSAGAGVVTMGGNGSQPIPAVMISYEDCMILKPQIGNGLSVTIETSTSKFRDSDLDNGIIAHEYGHGISNRLTGGSANTDCLDNLEQMGEGWSDYFALMLQLKAGDMGGDINGIGTYALGEASSGAGIRPYPYSTDLSINPLTYNDISGLSIPHGVGSVWCTMLWDMTWNLIEKYGFEPDVYATTGGNGTAMQLVMEAMKLQPCLPGFVDGRDAILAADALLFGGANSCEIWRAFGRRGLGVGASQGSNDLVDDGIESYMVPDGCPNPCTDQVLMYSNETIPNGTERRVNTSVTIDNSSILTGDPVSITATENIIIQPVFEIQSPTILTLDIGPCDESYLMGVNISNGKKVIDLRHSAIRLNSAEKK